VVAKWYERSEMNNRQSFACKQGKISDEQLS